jgi:hypothetical protein
MEAEPGKRAELLGEVKALLLGYLEPIFGSSAGK